MIFDSIVTWLFYVAEFLINLLPNADPSVNSFLTSGLANFRYYIDFANWFFDANSFFLVLTMVLTIEAGVFLWKAIRWIAGIFSGGLIH